MISNREPVSTVRISGRARQRKIFERPVSRGQWIALCAQRLASLRPTMAGRPSLELAQQLWEEVGSFDPVIAAEMEHEALADD
jgi:hypothetical protein